MQSFKVALYSVRRQIKATVIYLPPQSCPGAYFGGSLYFLYICDIEIIKLFIALEVREQNPQLIKDKIFHSRNNP